MNVSCPECQSVFRVDPGKLPVDGVRARCSVCGGVIMVPPPSSARVLVGAGAGRAGSSVLSTPPAPSPAVATPAYPGPVVDDPAPMPPAAPAPRSPTPVAREEPAIAGSTNVARRPINPFIANDPGQKARRLARALVSDIVAYHPQKREEGLRTGTLKQLFRDEIKKSYEEYVEQVGQPMAESTPHFQDALNDVLAGGRKVF
jgi:predicted Zn finger-like uncharacterized protein